MERLLDRMIEGVIQHPKVISEVLVFDIEFQEAEGLHCLLQRICDYVDLRTGSPLQDPDRKGKRSHEVGLTVLSGDHYEGLLEAPQV